MYRLSVVGLPFLIYQAGAERKPGKAGILSDAILQGVHPGPTRRSKSP